MRIQIVSPPSTGPLPLIDRIQRHGYIVSHSNEVPPDADLYLFFSGHEAMKHLTHGWVFLDLRHAPGLNAANWLPYTDLCLVRSTSDQADLIASQGCEPERVYVVPDTEGLLALLDQARDGRLAPAEVPERSKPGFLPGRTHTEVTMPHPQGQPQSEAATNDPSLAALAARLDVAEHQADVMQREYQVKSRVPLVGPLVAWLRRNLTSHLREPYLDPTLERQVALNRDLVKALQEVAARLANLEEQLSQLDERHDDD
jgi:hypothetical protein